MSGDWDQWATKQVNEIDDGVWQENPKEAMARTLARAGQTLAEHTRGIAAADAALTNAAYASAYAQTAALDSEFAKMYPDFMASPVHKEAVTNAVRRVGNDPRFQRAIANPALRPKAFAVVATLAERELGVPASTPRRPVDAPHGPASPDSWDVDQHRQQEAQRELLDYATLNNRRGG